MSLENPIDNLKLLEMPYPGRVVLIGMNRTGHSWRMITTMGGRSEGSLNRVYLLDQNKDFGEIIRTDAADRSKPYGDPENTIYTAHVRYGKNTVVSNGAQTPDIAKGLNRYRPYNLPEDLEEAQLRWETEGPKSDFTSRISGLVTRESGIVTFGRIVRNPLDITYSDRHVYNTALQPGYAAYISTYNGEGNTVPQRGDPVAIQLPGITLEDNVTAIRTRMFQPYLAGIAGSEVNIMTGIVTDRVIWNAQTPQAA